MSHAATLPDLRPWPEDIQPRGNYYPCPDGILRPRVTHILNYFSDGSENLAQWHEDQGKLVALEVVGKHLDWYRDMPVAEFLAKVAPEIKEIKAAKRSLDKAADIGTAVHKMVQWRIRGEMGLSAGPEPRLSDEATVGCMAFDDWWGKEKLKPIRCEQVLWDDHAAGQVDLLADGPEGLELLDWKSSNYIVPKHHIQVAQYLRMVNLWRPVRRARIVRLPKSLERLDVEVKNLGEVWNFKKRTEGRISVEDLLKSFDCARELFGIWS